MATMYTVVPAGVLHVLLCSLSTKSTEADWRASDFEEDQRSSWVTRLRASWFVDVDMRDSLTEIGIYQLE